MHPDDFLWYQNRISSLEQQLAQAQAEVERWREVVQFFVDTHIDGSGCNECDRADEGHFEWCAIGRLSQALNPHEAEDATA